MDRGLPPSLISALQQFSTVCIAATSSLISFERGLNFSDFPNFLVILHDILQLESYLYKYSVNTYCLAIVHRHRKNTKCHYERKKIRFIYCVLQQLDN